MRLWAQSAGQPYGLIRVGRATPGAEPRSAGLARLGAGGRAEGTASSVTSDVLGD